MEKQKQKNLVWLWWAIGIAGAASLFIVIFILFSGNRGSGPLTSNGPLNTPIPSGFNSPTGNPKPTITFPDYLQVPDKFIVDDKGLFADKIGGNKAVWVEQVIDSDTIKISAIVEVQNKEYITIKDIHLSGLADLSVTGLPCSKDKAKIDAVVSTIRKFIEHKAVYLKDDTGCGSQSNLKLVYIEVKDIGMPLEIYDLKGTNGAMVNKILLQNGLARILPGDCSSHNLEFMEDLKIAQVQKKGIWSECKE